MPDDIRPDWMEFWRRLGRIALLGTLFVLGLFLGHRAGYSEGKDAGLDLAEQPSWACAFCKCKGQ